MTDAEYGSLPSQTSHCLAQVQAIIDFAESEDIVPLSQIQKHLSGNRSDGVVRSEIKMAI